MIAGQFAVDALVVFAIRNSVRVQVDEAAVVLGQFLFDDVCLDGHAKVIRLPREIRGDVIILVLFEGRIAEVAPQNSRQAQFVRQCEGLRDLDDFAMRIVRAEIDGRADRRRAHIVRFLDRPKQNLLETVGIGQQFVVIDLHDERNLMRVLARHHPQRAKRGGDRVAPALDGQLDNVFGIEVIGVFGETGAA